MKTLMVGGLVMPLVGLTVGIVLTIFLKRYDRIKWRFFDAMPPFLTIGMNMMASTIRMADTWAYSLIGVCVLAILYALYRAIVYRELLLVPFFRTVWRSYLLVAVVWYIFILIWCLVHG